MQIFIPLNTIRLLDFRSLRLWRILATGFSFAIFGIGGIILALLVAPVCMLLAKHDPYYQVPGHQTPYHQIMCRRVYSASFRLYIWMMKSIGLLTYEVNGLENLKEGSIILANHPSLLDVVFLIALVPKTNCIVKGSLYRNFFTMAPIAACGYLNNDSSDLINHSLTATDSGSGLLIFPQGTRSSNASVPMRFRRGAANIALMSKSDICPVLLTCNPETLRKKENWYSVPEVPPHFTFRFLPPLNIDHLRYSDEPQSLRARKLTRFFEDYFTVELGKLNRS